MRGLGTRNAAAVVMPAHDTAGAPSFSRVRRARQQAAMVEFAGNAPVEFVISTNLTRRHLGPGQSAMQALNFVNTSNGHDGSKAQLCALSHAKVAEKSAVSERVIDAAAGLR
jgi:hypothetical protein